MSDTAKTAIKTAIVTGAARGIGRAIAGRMLQAGWQVVLTGLNGEAAEEAAAILGQVGGTALARRIDVKSHSSIDATVAAAVDAFGRLDVMVSNAGIMDRAPFLEMTEEFWHHVIDTNLTSAFLCGQAAARQLVAQGGGGRIVNTASNSGIFGGRGRAAYGASKAGLINLTQTMAIELAEHGILVNAVAPGPTKTRPARSLPPMAARRWRWWRPISRPPSPATTSPRRTTRAW